MRNMIKLPKPSQEEIDRMEEVKFYLFVSKLTNIVRGNGGEDSYELIKPLIAATGTNENLMEAAFNTIQTIACKPHELEVAVTARYMQYSYRLVQNKLMHSKKYRDLSLDYVEKHRENYLLPKLPEELTNEIKKFNENFRERIGFIFSFLNGELRKEEDREEWNS